MIVGGVLSVGIRWENYCRVESKGNYWIQKILTIWIVLVYHALLEKVSLAPHILFLLTHTYSLNFSLSLAHKILQRL
jgi:hypothetical protein